MTLGEWLCATDMTSGTRAIDFAVDEALEERAAAARIDAFAIEIIFHDVVGGDERRRKRARHQEPARLLRVTHGDMAEAVHNALVDEDTAGGSKVGEDGRIDWAAAARQGRAASVSRRAQIG